MPIDASMDSDQQEIGVTLMTHVDMISTFPDDIISNKILSLLPTKDLVRTSTLSTRWKHLYASIPVLNFQNESRPFNRSDPAFAGFISNVLNTVTNKLSHISQFYIDFNNLLVNISDIVSWIETATSHSVQRLHVSGYKFGGTPTPHSLFTCETLVSLKLDLQFVLRVPNVVYLPNLRNLYLNKIKFNDESVDESLKRLFSGCPVLERLMEFSSSDYHGRVFDVSVLSLKVFSLYWDHKVEVELSINCPNLEELECKSYATRGYSGDVFGSLKKCEIDVWLSEECFEQGKLIGLVRQVCKVQFLSLAGDSMQALLLPAAPLPFFENLTHLELESSAPNGWRLLASIFDSSPRLKTLDFPNGFFDTYNYFSNPFPPPEHVPVCLALHLKVIRFDKLAGEEIEYKWVEYFLTNALVLEKLEICLRLSEVSEYEDDPIVEGEGGDGDVDADPDVDADEGEGGCKGEEDRPGQEEEQERGQKEQEGEFDFDLEQNFEIAKRLLNFQRSSEVCQVVLSYDD